VTTEFASGRHVPAAILASFCLLLGVGRTVLATTYYVSPSGSDSSAGTAPSTPWATVAKVDSTSFEPGDRILFQRGGEWHGQLEASADGTVAQPITYSDFGDPKLSKPIFEGSDYIDPSHFASVGGGVFSFPVSASANGKVFWVYLNPNRNAANANIPLLAAIRGGAGMPPDSFFVSGDTVFINTIGADPAHPTAAVDPRSAGTAVSVGDRATGQDPAQGVVASNTHSNLVFNNLIGRETAQVGDGGKVAGGIIDAYVFRVQGGSNVTLSNDDGSFGGKHIFGATDTANFTAQNLTAHGAVDGVEGNRLGYGNATAIVSYADANQTGDSHRWIDCTVSDYSPSQPAFITHNDGAHSFKSILLQNLNCLGSPVALMPGTNVSIIWKGGSVQNNNLTAYTSPGTTELIDGVKVSGAGANIVVSGNATVQNCVIAGSGQDGGIQVSGPHNVIRFNTLAMLGYAGSAIHIQNGATDTLLLGNLFSGASSAMKIDGSPAAFSADYDFFDVSSAQSLAWLQAKSQEKHGATGDVMFTSAATEDYSLKPGSPAAGLVPAVGVTGISAYGLAHPRTGTGWDAGAYQTISSK
jgi:hypothetical protein